MGGANAYDASSKIGQSLGLPERIGVAMKSLSVFLLVSTLFIVAAQAAEFCTIDVYPTDNLAVFIYREGDIVRLRGARLTFTETHEGVFVNDELVIKRIPKGYTPEELSVYSRHELVAESISKGTDPQHAVAEYLERKKQVRLALTTEFVNYIDTHSVIEIIPILESMLDELDPERMYYSGFLPHPRSRQQLFLCSPTDDLFAAHFGVESVPPISINKYSDTVDMSEAPTRPFMDCGALTISTPTLQKLPLKLPLVAQP